MKNPQLILAFFWPSKLIKTLFTYFNDKIKPKPSPDGTLSPNTILFSDGRYCTVLGGVSRIDLNLKKLKVYESNYCTHYTCYHLLRTVRLPNQPEPAQISDSVS